MRVAPRKPREIGRRVIDKVRRLSAGLDLSSESVWPGLRNDLFVAHEAIYHFFATFCRDRRVLDAGCGTGYGSALLVAAGARSVLGVDLSRRSIRFARRRYKSQRLDFVVGDLENATLPPGSLDLVVASNVLEHLASPRRFLEPMGTWLSEGGEAVFAVPPITNEYQLRLNQDNPFHLSNLAIAEWLDLFRELGWSVRCYRQCYRANGGELDFSSPRRSSASVRDFEFPASDRDGLYTEATLGALFHLRRARG